jgi:pyruvate-ferredoxin/flavodoxin oxidoreductase
MSNTQAQEKLAVETGYWSIYRYNPSTDKLTIDSKAPTKAYEEFTSTQSRYFSLAKTNAESSANLISGAKAHASKNLGKLADKANKQ